MISVLPLVRPSEMIYLDGGLAIFERDIIAIHS